MTDGSALFSAILHDLRSFPPGTCLNTKLPAHFAGTSVFYLHFQVRFSLAMPLTTSLDMAAEKTRARGQFSPYREWYGRSMYNTYPIPTETPICAKMLSMGKRCGEIDGEANHKKVKSGKFSR